MIIGLTGKNASGKGEVAAYLKTKGFVYFSLSDELREEASKRGLEHSRDNLTKLGNELREKFGPNCLATKINNKIKQQLKNARKSKIFGTNFVGFNIKNNQLNNINNIKNYKIKNNENIINTRSEIIEKNNKKNKNGINFVVDSIRNPGEAKELMKNKDFILVGVDAPVELRFKRLLERNRAGDVKTLEEFKKQEKRENINNEANQQLNETFKLADKIIVNDGSLKELHKKVDDLSVQLKTKQ